MSVAGRFFAVAALAVACTAAATAAETAEVPAAPPAARLVDLSTHLRADLFDDIKISPDGRFYAATVSMQDRTVLVTVAREGLAVLGRAPVVANGHVVDFHWVSPERLVFSPAMASGRLARPQLSDQLMAMDYDGSDLKRVHGIDTMAELMRIARSGNGAPQAQLLDELPGDDRHVLVQVREPYGRGKAWVERVDVVTGASTKLVEAPVGAANFITDARGQVRLASGAEDDLERKTFHRAGDGAPWQALADQGKDGEIVYPLGLTPEGDAAYLQVERLDGTDEIVRHDLATGVRTRLLRDPVVDPGRILGSTRQPAVPVGSHFDGPSPRTAYFDEATDEARLFRQLEAAFPGRQVRLTSTTRDGRLALVEVASDTQAGEFYLFDTPSMQARHVASRRQWLEPVALAGTRPVKLLARDGLPLHGFLTVPAGAEANALPLVVLPHGGPFGIHDSLAFDEEVQILADAGYAVLKVNFRGSGNYGRRFREAGAGQWGRAMQDDLTDATTWAIAQGIADPARVCLYGASYGAYAALMGVAREPGMYRCAVGYVGVYDLQKLIDRDVSGEASENWHAAWIGPAARLGSVSPVTLAKNIRVPVFLAAGERDDVAPVYHTRDMERALRKAKVPVESLYYRDEGHGFYRAEHREEFYRRLLAFLAPHLGGRTAQPARAAAVTEGTSP